MVVTVLELMLFPNAVKGFYSNFEEEVARVYTGRNSGWKTESEMRKDHRVICAVKEDRT